MSGLWVVGGRQGRPAGVADRDHSPLYRDGVLARVDAASGEVVVVGAWRSSPEACGGAADRLGHALKGLARDGDRWLLVGERELLWVDDDGRLTDRFTHPWFNDLHDARRVDGALWIACSGLDCVLEVRGDDVLSHGVGASSSFDRGVDWRTVSTRPHAIHPNHLFEHDGSVWVTRFQLGDACRVIGEGHLEVPADRLHDGLPLEGRVWFTAVDGRLIGLGGPPTVTPIREAGTEPLGWCRGLAWHDDHWWVGMTRIRATRWRQNLAWLRGALRGTQEASKRPTRLLVVCRDGTVARTISLEPHGIDAIFAVVPGP